MGLSQIYTLEELAKHNRKRDLWVAIDGKAYDVSGYLDDHPGGAEILLQVAGQDATDAFDDVGHSEDAYETMEKLQVGLIAQETIAKTVVKFERVIEPIVPGASVSSGRPFASRLKPGRLVVGLGLAVAGLYTLRPGSTVSRTLGNLSPTLDMSVMGKFWGGVAVALLLNISFVTAMGLRLRASLHGRHKPIEAYPAYVRSKAPLQDLQEIKQPPTKSGLAAKATSLIDRRQLSPDTYQFVLKLAESDTPWTLPTGQHIQILAEIDGKNVQRSYTPTYADQAGGTLTLTIKIYPKGLMGNHLLALPLSSNVSIRGPIGSYRNYSAQQKWDRLGCIAGGSGITPIYQFVRAICNNPNDHTALTLLYGNETQADILLKEEMDTFARDFPDKFQVHYVLAKPPQGWQGESGWITKDMMKKYLPALDARTSYLLCGPPGMMNAMKTNLVAMGHEPPKPPMNDSSQIFLF